MSANAIAAAPIQSAPRNDAGRPAPGRAVGPRQTAQHGGDAYQGGRARAIAAARRTPDPIAGCLSQRRPNGYAARAACSAGEAPWTRSRWSAAA